MKREIEEKISATYNVVRLLGKGATSRVYEVFHKESRKKYAMKVSEDKNLLKKEAEVMSLIAYDTFPRLQEYLEGEQGYLVMEYVEGRNLQDMLDANVTLSVSEAVWLMGEVLKGLSYLHKHNRQMVYQDLKPANIVIEISGKVRLIDLGSVAFSAPKESETNNIRTGTYGYAAPEQFWQGMIPKPTWDVYAAGKLLGYLLTGHNPALPPYDIESYYINNRRVPDAVKEVLNRCLSEHAQARYTDAEDLLGHLLRAYEEYEKRPWKFKRQRGQFLYKKCIWLSEYRRIF